MKRFTMLTLGLLLAALPISLSAGTTGVPLSSAIRGVLGRAQWWSTVLTSATPDTVKANDSIVCLTSVKELTTQRYVICWSALGSAGSPSVKFHVTWYTKGATAKVQGVVSTDTFRGLGPNQSPVLFGEQACGSTYRAVIVIDSVADTVIFKDIEVYTQQQKY